MLSAGSAWLCYVIRFMLSAEIISQSTQLQLILNNIWIKVLIFILQSNQDIISGEFSSRMMRDWENNDKELLEWRAATGETAFEKSEATSKEIKEQEYFDKGVLLVAFVKSGVELAFETMVEAGIVADSAYYESLHETPLIANTIARKKLFEMNRIISDTAEYGCYLFDHSAKPLIKDYVNGLPKEVIGHSYGTDYTGVDNQQLIAVNDEIRQHHENKSQEVSELERKLHELDLTGERMYDDLNKYKF